MACATPWIHVIAIDNDFIKDFTTAFVPQSVFADREQREVITIRPKKLEDQIVDV